MMRIAIPILALGILLPLFTPVPALAECSVNRCTSVIEAMTVLSTPRIRYRLTEGDINNLAAEVAESDSLQKLQVTPDGTVSKLDALKNVKYNSKTAFLAAMQGALGDNIIDELKYKVLKHASKEIKLVCAVLDSDMSPLTCDPISGVFVCGDDAQFQGPLLSSFLVGKPATFSVSTAGECEFEGFELVN